MQMIKYEYLPDIKVTNLFFPFQASIAAERERGRGRLVDKEKEDFLTSSEKPQKRLKVSEQNLDADDPLGKFKQLSGSNHLLRFFMRNATIYFYFAA